MLRTRVAEGLRSGVLEHGDRLPSVREVADELDVDTRVVLAAYQQLGEEGLVEVRSRSGVFATAPGNAQLLPRRWMLEILVGAIDRDVPPLRFVDHVRSALITRRVRAAVLECNDDQLQSMAEELRTIYGLEVTTIHVDAVSSDSAARDLREVDILISAGHSEIVARTAALMGKPHIIARVRPALLERFGRLLARGPVYFLATDPRFGVKLRRLVAPMARSENLHVLLVDRDDLSIIPHGAPTYVMRNALRRFPGRKHAGREILPQRIFSRETSHEILSHILSLATDQVQDA